MALQDWRFFSDSIIEWKSDRVILAASYDFGTEAAAELPGRPQAFWTGGALWGRWNIHGPWSVACRPELHWDRNGRLTGSEELIKAITATGEYAWPQAQFIPGMTTRVEYHYDESSGSDGGFFRGAAIPSSGVPALTRTQHLMIVGLLWVLDQ